MTGDGSSIGTKFGIAFTGKWVWKMKDFIDQSFMDLFNPHYLYKDYDSQGTTQPLGNERFDDELATLEKTIGPMRIKVAQMDAQTAADLLGCSEEETEFHERFLLI